LKVKISLNQPENDSHFLRDVLDLSPFSLCHPDLLFPFLSSPPPSHPLVVYICHPLPTSFYFIISSPFQGSIVTSIHPSIHEIYHLDTDLACSLILISCSFWFLKENFSLFFNEP